MRITYRNTNGTKTKQNYDDIMNNTQLPKIVINLSLTTNTKWMDETDTERFRTIHCSNKNWGVTLCSRHKCTNYNKTYYPCSIILKHFVHPSQLIDPVLNNRRVCKIWKNCRLFIPHLECIFFLRNIIVKHTNTFTTLPINSTWNGQHLMWSENTYKTNYD